MPGPDRLEATADRLREEIERLLEAGRDVYRELQDAEGEQPENIAALRWLAERKLSDLDRRMHLAQCYLIAPDDERWHAAQRTAADLRIRLVTGRFRRQIKNRLRVRGDQAA